MRGRSPHTDGGFGSLYVRRLPLYMPRSVRFSYSLGRPKHRSSVFHRSLRHLQAPFFSAAALSPSIGDRWLGTSTFPDNVALRRQRYKIPTVLQSRETFFKS